MPNGTMGFGGRNVVAVIGVDRYHHWQRLANAVRDAGGAAALFRRLGFEQITAPLLGDRATGAAAQSLVTDDLKVLGRRPISGVELSCSSVRANSSTKISLASRYSRHHSSSASNRRWASSSRTIVTAGSVLPEILRRIQAAPGLGVVQRAVE